MNYITQHGMLIPDCSTATEEEIREGYRQMAADEEREAEANEWCEADIGECLDDDNGGYRYDPTANTLSHTNTESEVSS